MDLYGLQSKVTAIKTENALEHVSKKMDAAIESNDIERFIKLQNEFNILTNKKNSFRNQQLVKKQVIVKKSSKKL